MLSHRRKGSQNREPAVEGWTLLLLLSWGMLKTQTLCILLPATLVPSFHTSFFSPRDDRHTLGREVWKPDAHLRSSDPTQYQAAHWPFPVRAVGWWLMPTTSQPGQQPALWPAFMGTNTQNPHSLYCSLSLSSLLRCILLVEQTCQVDITCRNLASWLTQSSWIKFMKKNKNPIPFYTYSLSFTSMFFCFSVTALPHTYTPHAGLKSAKTECKWDASAYQLPSRHLWHLVARIWIWPASCCWGPCVYLCSISYIRRQFLLTPSGFAAVKVAILTASLLFSFFFYDFKSQRIPHMTEEERSFCELKRTCRCYFFLGLYCSIAYTLSLPQGIHMRSASGWRH